MKKLIIILCVCFMAGGCIFSGKKIVYTNPEKNITIELSEDELNVAGSLPLSDGSYITVSDEE